MKTYEEFETDLLVKCPEVFQGTSPGFEIRAGWYRIVENLCYRINSYISHKNRWRNNPPDALGSNSIQHTEPLSICVDQVKEKFGGLRFYYTGGDAFIDGMVNMAEIWASQTCEICGERGAPRKKPSGWLSTLCEQHFEKNQ